MTYRRQQDLYTIEHFLDQLIWTLVCERRGQSEQMVHRGGAAPDAEQLMHGIRRVHRNLSRLGDTRRFGGMHEPEPGDERDERDRMIQSVFARAAGVLSKEHYDEGDAGYLCCLQGELIELNHAEHAQDLLKAAHLVQMHRMLITRGDELRASVFAVQDHIF